ncbi:MAG: AAA family ATPase [Thermoguttaceae bacterium]|nr:AAA family ATPase [Thermoguttaceae bacterium]
MYITKVELKNWRNFSSVSVPLSDKTFIIGPNAVGKSNFLDAIRFLRDIASNTGGFQSAISARGGMKKIRCLYARKDPEVEITVELSSSISKTESLPPEWRYSIGFVQETKGAHNTLLTFEKIWKDDKLILERPNSDDINDPLKMSETWLEQTSRNQEFRALHSAFNNISYYHLVPQLLRHPSIYSGHDLPHDPFGQGFLEKINNTPEKTRNSRLKRINEYLNVAVPQLKELELTTDEGGRPHLQALYQHWRPKAGKQQEADFSDGTLRLIALLWSILENRGVLLLEEPELSLNSEIVARLPNLFTQAQRSSKTKRQFIITSHSDALLTDKSISLSDVLLFLPSDHGTICMPACEDKQSIEEFNNGIPLSEIVFPQTAPKNIEKLTQLTFPELSK